MNIYVLKFVYRYHKDLTQRCTMKEAETTETETMKEVSASAPLEPFLGEDYWDSGRGGGCVVSLDEPMERGPPICLGAHTNFCV